jgi:hypothetical protein
VRLEVVAGQALEALVGGAEDVDSRTLDRRSPRMSSAVTQVKRDPADEAMVARARERFTADRRRGGRVPWRRRRHAALPNLIIIGGLKCGTTSIHHYLGLHPEIHMSRPKELNFFCAELNWDLGEAWYRGRFDERFPVRGESSPHYTNEPRFTGVAERIHSLIPEAKLIYMVRDPIARMLSHFTHATGAGYETRSDVTEVLGEPDTAYWHRSMYWMQLQPYLERFDAGQISVITQEELHADRAGTMRRAFEFAGVDPGFTSEQFDREWERSSAKQEGRYQVMERAVKLPGLRSFDRNFDRLPESLRWMVEKVVHSPEAPPAPKPVLPDDLRERLANVFRPDAAALQDFAGRRFEGWSLG